MKQVSILSIAFLLFTALAFTDFPQQEKNKNDKKEQQENKTKNQDKKNNPGNSNANKNKNDQAGNKNQKDNQGKNNAKDKDNKNDNNDNRNYDARGNVDVRDGYKWDRETFKDRNKYRNQEKVTICHKFNNDNEPAVTLRVSVNALKAHMDHGDIEGNCPELRNDRYSNDYIRERNNYYERIQESREKVLYSQSILDYAVLRLTDSRLQLTNMQNRNLPAVEIERKQATVVELEQNVSLLETLIGVTANLLVNKLQ